MQTSTYAATSLCYQTSGSCALAPREVSHLRLVEDADVLVWHRQPAEASSTQLRFSGQSSAAEARSGVSAKLTYAAATATEPLHDTHKLIHGLVAATLALALLIASLMSIDAMAAHAQELALEGVSFEEVTVHAGESLWTLATDHGIDGLTTAQVVSVIEDQNSLTSALVQPGDTLIVPV